MVIQRPSGWQRKAKRKAMTREKMIATLERIVLVLGEEIGRLNDEVDELRARLARASQWRVSERDEARDEARDEEAK